jgi:NAD(P)-dependent dehydrogenase (short-subunit alcohol dehydrogenase family)
MVPKVLFPKVPDLVRQRCSERRKGLAGRTKEKLGSIDVLITSAGVFHIEPKGTMKATRVLEFDPPEVIHY